MLTTAAIIDRQRDLQLDHHYDNGYGVGEHVDHVTAEVRIPRTDGYAEDAIADMYGKDMADIVDDAWDDGDKTVVRLWADAHMAEYGPEELAADYNVPALGLTWVAADEHDETVGTFVH